MGLRVNNEQLIECVYGRGDGVKHARDCKQHGVQGVVYMSCINHPMEHGICIY